MKESVVKPGRPAIGKKRPKQMSIPVSEQERDYIKNKAKEYDARISITDYFLQLIQENEQKENT